MKLLRYRPILAFCEMKIGIVITNPNHHVDLTLEAAVAMKAMGHEPFYLSLCEMRRMKTPVDKLEEAGIPYFKQKDLPGEVKPTAGAKTLGANDSLTRKVVREAFWQLKMSAFVKTHLKEADRVWLLNDTAFPGNKITSGLKKRKTPFYLMQEGIRFPLPGESESSYGSGGAKKVMVWGERSAHYFQTVVSAGTEVVITGSPRFENFKKTATAAKPARVATPVLGVFTNPIDDQGFCSKDQKLALFENFVRRGAAQLNEFGHVLGVKSHPREDVKEYLKIAGKYVDQVLELPGDIVEAINQVYAGMIFASTVGLELLLLDKRLAQIEIPGHGYVFDYDQDPDLLKIPLEGSFDLSVLQKQNDRNGYIQSHIYHEGEPVDLICKAILE